MGRVLASHARATIVTVGAAAAVLLAGCSGGAGAQPGPSSGGPPLSSTTSTSTASTSPPTTSSPSGTASVAVPAAARAHTDEGAKAFARFFYQIASRSQFEADSSELRSLSDKNCSACLSLIELADDYQRRGVHTDRDSLRVEDAVMRPESKPNAPVVDVLALDQASKVVRRSDGAVVSSDEAAKLTFRTTLSWRDQSWVVTDSVLVQ